MAAGLSVDLDRWRLEFDELMLRAGGRFARVEPRRRTAGFVRGLLAGLPRVNCWTIAGHAGENGPRGMRRLLSAAVWDEAGMRDDLRGYVLEHFAGPGAVLAADETGDLKKGTATAGTQRQYAGTAGRTENAQVAVYLAYAAPAGTAFIGRALYLPRSWTSDPARCRAAGVPRDTAFATRPALAKAMITGALDAGTPAAWVTADEVCGQDPKLRAELARRGLGYVLAIPKRHLVATGIGARQAIGPAGRLPARARQRLSAGPGAEGPRWYDWAFIETADPAVTEGGGPHWLLIRRRISDGEYAFYRAHAPRPVPLAQRVRVAGSRWRIEDGLAAGKELAALDEHQVRSWASWHRWTVLALLACAFLAVLAAAQPGGSQPHEEHLIPLTCQEIRRLFTGLCQQPPAPATQLHWSRWRRRHQATARACHYRRRALAPTRLRSVAGELSVKWAADVAPSPELPAD
jgi:SRSO17 transposase